MCTLLASAASHLYVPCGLRNWVSWLGADLSPSAVLAHEGGLEGLAVPQTLQDHIQEAVVVPNLVGQAQGD